MACVGGLSKELIPAIGAAPALEPKSLWQVEVQQLWLRGRSHRPGAASGATSRASCRAMEKTRPGRLRGTHRLRHPPATHPPTHPPSLPGPAVLTAAALPAAPPVRGRLCPAAPAPWQVLAAGLGEGPHLGPVIDARGAQSVKSARVGIAGEKAAVRRRRGPAEDVGDAVGGAGSQLGAKPGGGPACRRSSAPSTGRRAPWPRGRAPARDR